jgi:hypothetical protein
MARARREAERADREFDKALSAMRELSKLLNEPSLAGHPVLQSMRERSYQFEMTWCRDYLNELPQGRLGRARDLRVANGLAWLCDQVGKADESLALYEWVVRDGDRLFPEQSEDPVLLDQMIYGLEGRAYHLGKRQGVPAEVMEGGFQRGFELACRLVTIAPGYRNAGTILEMSGENLATWYRRTGRGEEVSRLEARIEGLKKRLQPAGGED